uniref:Uncharacterized protein n=1 Tax=Amphimedon queenslandica TaxID=400682 RepID=A0A1X7TUM8_AMPQE
SHWLRPLRLVNNDTTHLADLGAAMISQESHQILAVLECRRKGRLTKESKE